MLTSSNELPITKNPSQFNIKTQTMASYCGLNS